MATLELLIAEVIEETKTEAEPTEAKPSNEGKQFVWCGWDSENEIPWIGDGKGLVIRTCVVWRSQAKIQMR